MMCRTLCRLVLATVLCGPFAAAQDQPAPFNPQGQPNRNRPGPWDNDVLVYVLGKDGPAEKLATFPRAGVATVARLKDGRLIAAHQYFPADNDADFDKVAVHFSADEGRTWTPPQVIRVEGLPEGMRFPFDPTLVPLPDGRVRMYFTSLKGRRMEEDRPAIYSAVSTDGVSYVFEPGVRFGVEGRPVIDCAVALHAGVFHLFAPDNGAGHNPGVERRAAADRPRPGVGYHATSPDGLSFTRQADVQSEGGRGWLGNAQSDGDVIRFFGTGGPSGVWMAVSADGQTWKAEDSGRVPGADPGAVKLKDGRWLLVVTGPPREGRQPGATGTEGQRAQPSSIMAAVDANSDGVIDEQEIDNASAVLRKLDRNGDRKLTPEELRPARPEGSRGREGQAPPAAPAR